MFLTIGGLQQYIDNTGVSVFAVVVDCKVPSIYPRRKESTAPMSSTRADTGNTK